MEGEVLMPTVKLLTEEDARGEVKAMFEEIKKAFGGMIPPTFQAMANHPDYLRLVLSKMHTVMEESTLDKKTKIAIAYTISVLNNCEACITMYTKQLKDAGFDEKQIIELLSIIDLVGSMNHFNNGLLIKPQQ